MPLDPTPVSDYAHWNEDAQYMWYQEVGRFSGAEDPPELEDETGPDVDYDENGDPVEEYD